MHGRYNLLLISGQCYSIQIIHIFASWMLNDSVLSKLSDSRRKYTQLCVIDPV